MINTLIVGFFTVLNVFRIDVTFFMKVYTVCDTVSVYMRPDTKRRTQLIIHHVSTCLLLLCANTDGFKRVAHFIPDIIDVEISTLFLLLSRHFKFLKSISKLVWIYYRLVYFPLLVNTIENDYGTIDTLYSFVGLVCLRIIEYLGYVWTLEALKVPKRYYRPCVVSITSCMIILLKKSFARNEYLIFCNVVWVLISSVLHHSHYAPSGAIQKFDVCAVIFTVLHGTYLAGTNSVWWLCMLVSCVLFSCARRVNQKDELRDWDNLYGLVPHMLMHASMSSGVYYLCMK